MAHVPLQEHPKGLVPRLATRYTKRRSARWWSRWRPRRTTPASSSPWAAWRRRSSSAGRSSIRPCAGWPCRPTGPDRLLVVHRLRLLRRHAPRRRPGQGAGGRHWRASDLFDDRERVVLEYAEVATGCPAEVSEELAARIRAHLSDAEFVELAAWVALENFRSRFNAGLGLRSQGFSDRCEIPKQPSPRSPLPDAEADAATFEEWRSLLFGIAYRMLGSAADAEDVVQDASIRWLRRGDAPRSGRSAPISSPSSPACAWTSSTRPAPNASPTRARGCPSRWWSTRRRPPSRRTRCRSPSWSCSRSSRHSSGPPICSTTSSATPSRRWPARWGGRPPHAGNSGRGRGSTSRSVVSASMRTCATGASSPTGSWSPAPRGICPGLLSMLSDDVVVWTDGGGKVRAAMRPGGRAVPQLEVPDERRQEAAGRPAVDGPQRAAGHRLPGRRASSWRPSCSTSWTAPSSACGP